MAATIYLVRHAVHAAVDRILVGRSQQTGLNGEGLLQARRLASYFARQRIACVHSSPQLRARQTAAPIAHACGMPFLIVPEVEEIDAGDWTGRSFDELDRDPRWRQWNSERGSARIPNGEGMDDVRKRVLAHLSDVAVSYAEKRVVVVTHAEIIRTVILHCRGLPIQAFRAVQVGPASVTTVSFGIRDCKVLRENEPVDVLVAA